MQCVFVSKFLSLQTQGTRIPLRFLPFEQLGATIFTGHVCYINSTENTIITKAEKVHLYFLADSIFLTEHTAESTACWPCPYGQSSLLRKALSSFHPPLISTTAAHFPHVQELLKLKLKLVLMDRYSGLQKSTALLTGV